MKKSFPSTFAEICEDYLNAEPEAVFSEHGKSFYFASMVFKKARLQKIAVLYRLCRFIDDCADELPVEESELATKTILNALERPGQEAEIDSLFSEVEAWGVSRQYVKELVIGAKFDADGGEIATMDDLKVYCYRVAGVVGLMMCPLIGVSSRQAYPHAIDLGIGMQLTNICRDILEDARRGRSYVPLENLARSGSSVEVLAEQKVNAPAAVKDLVRELLDEADRYYQSAYEGLAFIPFRPRLVILLAGEVYRHIGVKIRRADYEVLAGRTYLSLAEKLWVAAKTTLKVLSFNFWIPKAHLPSLHKSIASLPGAHR